MTSVSAPTSPNYLIVINPLPNKKKKQALNRLLVALKTRGWSWRIYETAPNLTTNQIFFKKHLKQYTDIVALGGDGTLHIIANCMAHSHVPLAIIPCGTGNDFARAWFNKEDDPITIALSTHSKAIDLGKCNDRYFVNVLGVGFDAELVKQLERSKMSYWRSCSYLLKTLMMLPTYQEPTVTIQLENQTVTLPTFIATFANSQYFGGGMKIAPFASPHNHQLDYCIIKKAPFFKKLYYLSKVFSGNHLQANVVSYGQSQQAVITTCDIPLEADGEFIGHSPCNISIEANALRLKTA
ncbi:diacylglycerol/lipid kinase family protein [Flocculibacter collagenilyticus]|uniref:diacylglycerol/lipid kinase family protein n=1 Tax=Flocculibacter collagenilyticus TaxID=2744479 RepID=UPI0018F651D9|nr:diacylglycerol kinase family protein [Flocculibacter collagenilyticus]